MAGCKPRTGQVYVNKNVEGNERGRAKGSFQLPKGREKEKGKGGPTGGRSLNSELGKEGTFSRRGGKTDGKNQPVEKRGSICKKTRRDRKLRMEGIGYSVKVGNSSKRENYRKEK